MNGLGLTQTSSWSLPSSWSTRRSHTAWGRFRRLKENALKGSPDEGCLSMGARGCLSTLVFDTHDLGRVVMNTHD